MNKEQFINAAQPDIVKYEGSKFFGEVYVKEMTARELSEMVDLTQLPENEGLTMRSVLLIHTLCNSKGERFFEIGDRETVEGFGVSIVQDLFEIAQKLNGMDKTTDDLEKN